MYYYISERKRFSRSISVSSKWEKIEKRRHTHTHTDSWSHVLKSTTEASPKIDVYIHCSCIVEQVWKHFLCSFIESHLMWCCLCIRDSGLLLSLWFGRHSAEPLSHMHILVVVLNVLCSMAVWQRHRKYHFNWIVVWLLNRTQDTEYKTNWIMRFWMNIECCYLDRWPSLPIYMNATHFRY